MNQSKFVGFSKGLLFLFDCQINEDSSECEAIAAGSSFLKVKFSSFEASPARTESDDCFEITFTRN